MPKHLGQYLNELVAVSSHVGGTNADLPRMKDVWPGLQRLVNQILKNLQGSPGYVVLQALPLLTLEQKYHEALLLRIAETLGIPGRTGGANSKLIWEVRPRSDLPTGYVPSITERDGAADLHTDSQYRSYPEGCVLLFVVRPASSGGETLLLDADTLLESLTSGVEGRAAYDVLRQARFPFAVPMAFRTESQTPEYVAATIFSETPVIRYRHDAIIEGFAIDPDLATKDARWALDTLSEVIRNTAAKTTREALSAGDIILINNHRLLHGRTDFTDTRRLLLRLRIDIRQPQGQAEHDGS